MQRFYSSHFIYFPINYSHIQIHLQHITCPSSIARPQNPKISILISLSLSLSLCNYVEFVFLSVDNWLPTYIALPYILPTSATSWSMHWAVRTHINPFYHMFYFLVAEKLKQKEKYTKFYFYFIYVLCGFFLIFLKKFNFEAWNENCFVNFSFYRRARIVYFLNNVVISMSFSFPKKKNQSFNFTTLNGFICFTFSREPNRTLLPTTSQIYWFWAAPVCICCQLVFQASVSDQT